MTHVAPANFTFDLSDGMVIVEVAAARRVLQSFLDAAAEADGGTHVSQSLGYGGDSDLAIALLGLLSGTGSDADEYTLELFKIAANKIIDSDRLLAHCL